MRLASVCTAVCVALGPAAAQKVCASANLTAKPKFQGTIVPAWFAFPVQIRNATTVTAADFLASTNSRLKGDGTLVVGFFSDANGLPGRVLGRATTTVRRGVPGFYGGRFAKPVPVQPGRYYVAFRSAQGVTPGIKLSGTVTPYFWGPPTFKNWIGPVRKVRWSYRLYCGTHKGAWTSYGTSKPGSGGAKPLMAALGFPNTTNTVSIQVIHTLGGSPSVLVLGSRTRIQLPIGVLLALPVAAAPQSMQGFGVGLGWSSIDLALPNQASLAGVKLAWQSWILDVGAASGLAHTQGLEMTIGH